MMLLIDSRDGDAGPGGWKRTSWFPGVQLTNLPDRKEATARRIAQWAINVVDFRDPDATMTPFEFDLEPFDENGWSVDDDYRTNVTDANFPEDAEDRAIVWGCEHPELIITETVAWHDRRVRDTARELPDADGPDGGDAKTRKLPAGERILGNVSTGRGFGPVSNSARHSTVGAVLWTQPSAEQSDRTQRTLLSAAIQRRDQSRSGGRVVDGSPVWRIAIGQPDMSNPRSKAVMLPALRELDPNIQNPNDFDPNDESMLLNVSAIGTAPDAGITYDRYVIFSNVVPPNVPGDRTRYYFNRGAAPLVQPGHYAVVGPYRPLKYHGSRGSTLDNHHGQPTEHAIG